MLDKKPYTLDRIVRIAISIAMVIGFIWLLGYLSDVLIPFAIAFLLAYLINPLVLLLQKKITNHIAAVFTALFIVFGVLLVVVSIVFPLIGKEIAHMGRLLSELVHNSDLARQAALRLPSDIWQVIKDYAASEDVQQFFKTDNFLAFAEQISKKIMPGVWGILSGTANFIGALLGIFVIFLYLVFLLMDYQKLKDEWRMLLPKGVRGHVVHFVGEFDTAMNRYFRAQALVAMIVGILFAIGFGIIGMPLGILLGLFIGLLNMVPYLQLLGILPAALLAIIYALESGSGIAATLSLTALVFVVVQLIQETILIPKIMGKVTGLSPAMILLSLSIWGKLLGLLGLLIALPMTCLLLAYYRRYAHLVEEIKPQVKEENASDSA